MPLREVDHPVLWRGRPGQGLAWRPQDLGYTTRFAAVGAAAIAMSVKGEHWLFLALVSASLAYALIGRFFHDAALRKRISYILTQRGMEIWQEDEAEPRCIIELHRLTNLRPLFVTGSGRGSVELPPGGWSSGPEWANRWDRLVPAIHPCRRLELLDDVLSELEIIRREASRVRFGTAKPAIAIG